MVIGMADTVVKEGYGRSVLWSVLFSPVIGLIITLSSKRLEQQLTENDRI